MTKEQRQPVFTERSAMDHPEKLLAGEIEISLQKRFNFFLIYMVSVVLIVFSLILLGYNLYAFESALDSRINRITKLAKTSLPTAVWQFNFEYVNDFLKSLSLQEDIILIQVIADDNIMTVYKNKGDKGRPFQSFVNNQKYKTSHQLIQYKTYDIGTFYLVMSRDRVKKQILYGGIAYATLLLLVIMTIFLANWFLTKKYVFHPLSSLEHYSREVAKGNFDAKVNIDSVDEIGALAVSLQWMVKQIQAITASRDAMDQAIKDREQALVSLQNSQDQYRRIYDNALVGLFKSRLADGKMLEVNYRMAGILGYASAADCIDDFIAADHFVHPDQKKKFLNRIKSKGRLDSFKALIRRPDGKHIWLELSGEVTRDKQHIEGVVKDITDQQETEAALSEKDTQYRGLISKMNAGFALHQMIYDENGTPINYKYLQINENFELLTGLTSETVLGKTVRDILPNIESYWVETFGTVAKSGLPIEYENYSAELDKYFSVKVYSPKKDQFATIITDITDNVNTQKQVQDALKEKEVLLREIHHRVKNNLQMILSILNLQMTGIEDEKVISILNDSKARIISITKVHEVLHKSDDLSAIDLKQYFEDLLKFLTKTLFSDSNLIRVHSEIEQIPMEIDMVIACGLILNEVVTNALKHAFPEKSDGQISLKIRRLEDNRVGFTISDNGIGIDNESAILERDSTGINLIKLLVTGQLDGTITAQSHNGLTYEIRFPIQKE